MHSQSPRPRQSQYHVLRLISASLLVLFVSCAKPAPTTAPLIPTPGKRVEARRGMVAASSADAAAIGLAMLQRGGNAIDAAVATAFALGVVDHSQTGIGGYGIATIWLARQNRAEVLEFMGRTGADPAWGAADPTPSGFVNPRLAIVPGFVSGLLTMHARHGALPRVEVLAPAIRLARDGFVVGPLMHRVLAAQRGRITASPAAAVFLPNGEVPALGDRIVQSELADILEAIARGGAGAFYEGEYARRTTEQIRAAGGLLTEADFAAYAPVERRPACSPFLEYRVLGAAGAAAGPYVMAMLNVAETAGIHRLGDPTTTPGAAARLADALSVGVQDLRRYAAGPEWRPSPVRGVTSTEYAAERAGWRPGAPAVPEELPDAWAHEGAAMPAACAGLETYPASARPFTETAADAEWGVPAPFKTWRRPAAARFAAALEARRGVPLPGPGRGLSGGVWQEFIEGWRDAGRAQIDAAADLGTDAASNTSHLSVIDADRNVVSLTTSIGVLFGSGVYAGGMFLNSSGNLFRPGTRAPNRSPSSAVAPLIVMEGDQPRLAVGAAGAAYIPGAVAQVIVRVAGLRQDVYSALAAPRMNPSALGGLEMEAGFTLPVYRELRAHGYVPSTRIADLMFAAVHAIVQRPDGTLIGAADPRRDGAAAGY